MAEITLTPVIISALLTPNPVEVGQTLHISISAVEAESVAQTEIRLCGEWLCGEV